ncbi:unnamed protein product [Ranitomeya imitator]|uniref:EGF-like domain-containing protein n=1 Tax=Ranitomeya imitator TaxID=111125 RepID=A0ABN9L9R9_9NEOB|nr:unnamed protein product [Ranitomeya imitator]
MLSSLFSSSGEHCEVSSRSGRCVPGVCKNGGTCINLLIGGFKCKCPPGDFEKPYCEMTTRSFPPLSFVTFKGLRQRFHFTVSLIFATRERNALILYNGRFNEKHDFIALEIIEEQIQLTFSADLHLFQLTDKFNLKNQPGDPIVFITPGLPNMWLGFT